MVNQPLLTLSTVPQVSPVATPKWQTACPGWTVRPGGENQWTSARQDVVRRNVVQHDRLVVVDHLVGGHRRAAGCVVPEGREMANDVAVLVGDSSPAVAV